MARGVVQISFHRVPRAGEPKDGEGFWLVDLEKEITFDVTLRFRAPGAAATLTYACGSKEVHAEIAADATSLTLRAVPHPAGRAPLSATITAKKPYGADYVELLRSR